MEKSIVDFLVSSVERFPGNEAVVHNERRIQYSDLWRAVSWLSSKLTLSGLKKGERVTILMENSPEYIAAYYAILHAGGVAVALNSTAKASDLANWIEHCGSHYLIADAGHKELASLESLTTSQLTTIKTAPNEKESLFRFEDWATENNLDDSEKTTPSSTPLSKTDTAAIIYTSGTTGAPKGVTLTHGNITANTCSILEYLKLETSERLLCVLPFYYSYGNSVLHTHIAVGGCLILQNSLAFPGKVVQAMVDEKVSGFSGVASTYGLLMNRVKLDEYDLSSLKYLTQAGGKMPSAQIQKVRTLIPNANFVVMYGQTEASARLAYLPADKLDEKMGSAGIAIPGVEIEIRDKDGNKCPVNTVGEIFARGDNIMKGYWAAEDATNEVIIEGWLKTGDLALMDEEGFIFIQGRNSDMIKVGANRISPQEIEEAIAELDPVAEVAAIGVPDDLLGEVIKAVIVVKDGSSLEVREVKAHCKNRLALFKLPKFVEFVNELPKTASGKVQRYLLADSQDKH